MKNSIAIPRECLDRWPARDATNATSTAPQVLSPRGWAGAAVLVGELIAAAVLLASGSVAPVLVRSLQLFLRF